ncbi:MAG: hypothetical protein ACK40G_14620 [Cytophagaceae bacterium]
MRLISFILGMFFLGSSLLPMNDTCELSKIPELCRHYQSHIQENEQLGFVEFLVMHYLDSEHSSKENHSELPYFSHFHTVSPLLVSFFEIKLEYVPSPVRNEAFNQNESSSYSGFVHSFWQPPKA